MRKGLGLSLLVVAAVLATIGIEHLLLPNGALQAQEVSVFGDHVVYAGVRRDTEKNESFIFVNPKTGDIWVYEDTKVKEHYRLIAVGQDLQKIDR